MLFRSRQSIFDAAVACDYDQLETLAQAGQPGFNYSFGEEGSPGQFWRDSEERDEPVLAALVRVLNLAFVQEEGTYYWPDAHRFDPLNLTEEQQAALDELLSENGDIAVWDEGTGYLGYRAAITADGDWTFFVTGD